MYSTTSGTMARPAQSCKLNKKENKTVDDNVNVKSDSSYFIGAFNDSTSVYLEDESERLNE